MFVRCARICCLCFKQCGTNIEAAHIIAEADGGPNTEDNGIPACMDCHTEISHYDPRQPKGNRFTPGELRQRRDRVYQLADSGVLFAQIVALRLKTEGGAAVALASVPTSAPPALSPESKSLIESIKAGLVRPASTIAKLHALGGNQRALVLDELVREPPHEHVTAAVGAIVKDGATGPQEKLVLAEQMLRKATLNDSPKSKAAFMNSFPVDVLKGLDETLRAAFFHDLLVIIRGDQFNEVNEIVPALSGVQDALPVSMAGEYVDALIEQAGSAAYHAAPAAKRLLITLADELVGPALEKMTLKWRYGDSREAADGFIKRTKKQWPATRQKVLKDYLSVKWETFVRRHGDPAR